MNKIRLLCRTAHTYGHHKSKTGFDNHNLRLDDLAPEKKNYNQENSHKNKIFRNNEIVSHSQFDDLIDKVNDDQTSKMKSVKNDLSDSHLAELNLSRSRTKTKFKKWADKSKGFEEVIFFKILLEKVGNEEINATEQIEKLKSLGKISRLNDKVKAIKQIEKCNKLLNVSENNSLSLKVISSEKLFKIPDQWNTEIKAEDWNTVVNSFHNQFYSNFDAYYTAIHLDEKSAHAHHRMSGFNKKTKSFDLPDHELNMIRKLFKNENLYDGKKWSKLDQEELKDFGERYQKVMFKYCNRELQKLGYEIEAVKRTPTEVKIDNHTYSNSKIRNRIFNGTNKLKEDVKNWFETVTEDIKKAVEIHLDIERDHSEIGKSLSDEVDLLIEEEAKRKKYRDEYQSEKYK